MASKNRGKPANSADNAKHLLAQNQINVSSCSIGFPPEQHHTISHASLLLGADRGCTLHDFYNSYPLTSNDNICASSGFTLTNDAFCASFSGLTYQSILRTLSVVQENLQQLQSVVRRMAHGSFEQSILFEQREAVAAGFTSIISDLLTTSSDLLQNSPSALVPEVTRTYLSDLCIRFNSTQNQDSFLGGLEGFMVNDNDNRSFAPDSHGLGSLETNPSLNQSIQGVIDHTVAVNGTIAPIIGTDVEMQGSSPIIPTSSSKNGEDLDLLKDEDENGDGETLPPGSFQLVEMDASEILAEHTHFCEICGKGFKRDANLRMHMRGHGEEYKTPAALARPDKAGDGVDVKVRRFSCPYVGCKRNKQHSKFQPLKTMLCVKNHYRRSHCPKMFTCSKCKSKHFSVVADLKTHEKHCGQCKWLCSCGTTFSRKDKLFGHIGLFTGHTPATPLSEGDGDGTGGVAHADSPSSMAD